MYTNLYSRSFWENYFTNSNRHNLLMTQVGGNSWIPSFEVPSFGNVYNVNFHKSKEEKEEDKANLAALIGSVMVISSSFLFGRVLKDFFSLRKDYLRSHELKQKIEKDGFGDGGEIQRELSKYAAHQYEIDRIDYSRIKKYMVTSIGMLLSGSMMAAGGFFSMTFYITAGSVSLVAMAAFGAFSLAYHWNDTEEKKPHHEIVKQISESMTQERLDILNALRGGARAPTLV